VKLEPSDVEAWNALGHCFWKKRDLGSARDCYSEAQSKVGDGHGHGHGGSGSRSSSERTINDPLMIGR